jgi:hypothetical protein
MAVRFGFDRLIFCVGIKLVGVFDDAANGLRGGRPGIP